MYEWSQFSGSWIRPARRVDKAPPQPGFGLGRGRPEAYDAANSKREAGSPMFRPSEIRILLPLVLVGLGLLVPGSHRARAADPGRAEVAAWLQNELAAVDRLIAGQRWQDVVDRAQSALKSHPKDPVYSWQFQERLGLAFLKLDQLQDALAALEASTRGESSRASVHRNLATTLMRLGRRGRALSEFRQALELAPRDCDIRLEFSQVLLEFGNYAEARVQLARAADLCEPRVALQRARARLELADGNAALAADLLQEIYSTQPTVEVRRTWQQALQQSGQDQKLYDLLLTIPRERLSGTELTILIETEAKLGRREISLAYANRAEGLGAGLPDPQTRGIEGERLAGFWGRIALTLLESGDNLPALRAADRAVALAPDNVVYRNNRVVLLTRLGRDQEARREWKRVLELDPSLGDSSGSIEDR